MGSPPGNADLEKTAPAAPAHPPAETLYYYRDENVGARAFHAPLNFIIEGGFGAMYDRRVDRFDYLRGGRNLARSLAHPLETVSEYGWRRFATNEVVPTPEGQGWSPNWGWHLVGGGFRTRLLKEYFISHGYSYPTLSAWSAMYSMHLINELIQAEKYRRASVDALADLLIFDWLGKLLFEIDAVNRIATGVLHLSEWSHQSQWNPMTNRLINNGQLYWFRLHVAGPVSLSGLTGEQANTVNITLSFDGAHQLSFGAGARPKDILVSPQGDAAASGVGFNLGFYYSRSDNPLLTVTFEPEVPEHAERLLRDGGAMSGGRILHTSRLMINVYPGWLLPDSLPVGLSLAWSNDATFVGVSSGHWPFGFTASGH